MQTSNLQSVLLSDYAIIAYEAIIIIVLIYFIMRFRKERKQWRIEQEEKAIKSQTKSLDESLINQSRR